MGMKSMRSKSFWRSGNSTISESDILVIVLDARFIHETLNREIIRKIKELGKPYLYAITKSDLTGSIEKSIIPKPYVVVSTPDRRGKSNLRERILIIGERKYGKDCRVKVGVLGYPNVGKSSVINMLKGRKSASTSISPGHTKSEKFIRADSRILLIDTPGVIPYGERDELKHVLIGTKDPAKIRHPETVLEKLMDAYPGAIERHFGVEPGEDHSETIERIALKRNLLRKGGLPDVQRAARMVIRDLQKGRIAIQ